jgi:hypothetical protein
MKQTLILLLLLVASFAFTIEQKTQHIDQIATETIMSSFSEEGKDEVAL